MRALAKIIPLFAFLASCSSNQTIFLPEGNAQAGKIAFSEFQCYSCHLVDGDSYPDPSAITPIFVTLGAKQHSQAYLAESIIAPSHQFAQSSPPAGQVVPPDAVKSGNRSRMTDFSDRMTVRQLLDIVAYLRSLEQKQ